MSYANILFPYVDSLPYEKKAAIWNNFGISLYWISPQINRDIGKIEPPNKVDGLLAYANGTDWQPLTNVHQCLYSGVSTLVGGNASETVTITGVLATDEVQVTLKTEVSEVALISAYCGTGNIIIKFSANPGAATIFYTIWRAAGAGVYRYDGTNSVWVLVG